MFNVILTNTFTFSSLPPEEQPCERWTRWFNTDEPCATGDREITSVIADEYPNDMCPNPLFMEAVVAITGQSAASAGQVLLHNHVDLGLVCRHADQPSGEQCFDYKVRFCCDSKYLYLTSNFTKKNIYLAQIL